MGWTHDYRDVSRNRRSGAASAARSFPGNGTPDPRTGDSRIGIPHILRRRARWVGARLRHARSD
ncbi:hypothetical protein [Streptomyces sp. NBC_01262]|uniref:hypothetical protein n=1 Tax=Streptomyces sp. NBC_01262 TaxID=2903803 RepID=UPI002E36F9F2|nr:hypothetical protein [Streptomyces sp. NBC_01262]